MVSSSGGRAAAGALRIGNAVGAAFGNKRVLEPVEAQLMVIGGTLMFGLAVLFFTFPRALAYPLVFILTWLSIALIYRGVRMYWTRGADRTLERKAEIAQETARRNSATTGK